MSQGSRNARTLAQRGRFSETCLRRTPSRQEERSISAIIQATGITPSSLYRHLPPQPELTAENQQNA